MRHRSFATLMGVDPENDRLHSFETSWVFPPFVLFCIRASISLYAFVSTFFIYGWNGTHDESRDSRRSFSYFTHLSFWGVAFYFLFAALHTFLYQRTGRSVLLDQWPRALRALHSLFYSTIVNFPIIVAVVYWALLYDGAWYSLPFDGWRNVSTHILPAFFSIFEIVFTMTTPPPFLHLLFLILILLLYVGLAYLTHSTQGFYTYAFLDPGVDGENASRVAGYIFAILGSVVVLFVAVWLVILVRHRLLGVEKTKRAKTQGYWDSRQDAEVALEMK